jgi:hypothetical protein
MLIFLNQNKLYWYSNGINTVLEDSDSYGKISEDLDEEEQLKDFEFDDIVQHFEFGNGKFKIKILLSFFFLSSRCCKAFYWSKILLFI